MANKSNWWKRHPHVKIELKQGADGKWYGSINSGRSPNAAHYVDGGSSANYTLWLLKKHLRKIRRPMRKSKRGGRI